MATPSPNQPIFSGRYRHALDKKHRITIPSRWRLTEEDEFFVVPDQTNSYLLVMPPAEFQGVSEMVEKQEGLTRQEKRLFIRNFYSSAVQCFTDKQGRLLLPQEHCKQVDLKDDDEVVIAGSLARFEIWNSKRWDENSTAGIPTYKKVADLVGL